MVKPRQPAAATSTMPARWSHLDEIVAAVRWVNEHDDPPRGEV